MTSEELDNIAGYLSRQPKKGLEFAHELLGEVVRLRLALEAEVRHAHQIASPHRMFPGFFGCTSGSGCGAFELRDPFRAHVEAAVRAAMGPAEEERGK